MFKTKTNVFLLVNSFSLHIETKKLTGIQNHISYPGVSRNIKKSKVNILTRKWLYRKYASSCKEIVDRKSYYIILGEETNRRTDKRKEVFLRRCTDKRKEKWHC